MYVRVHLEISANTICLDYGVEGWMQVKGPCEKRNWAKTEREARNVGCERGGHGECG